jgi:nicotinamidase-related amidase
MLIEVEESLLLVVDAQARLAPAVAGHEACLERLRLLILAAKQLGVPILATEQYPKGLGPTVETLAELLEPEQIHAKLAFSAAADPKIRTAVEGAKRPQIVICGMEAHVCVLQSALGFLGLGLRPIVVADAVASRRLESKTLALARLRSSGVEVVDTEMVVFEWLREAGTPAFKALAPLIK